MHEKNETIAVMGDAIAEGRTEDAASIADHNLRGHVDVDKLPQAIRNALDRCGYRRASIEVLAELEFNTFVSGGSGYRGFARTPNGEWLQGSWGGSNPFSKGGTDTSRTVPIERGQFAIHGSEGGSRPTYATVSMHPLDAVEHIKATPELSPELADYLAGIVRHNSGGRVNALGKGWQTSPETAALVAAGMLVRKGKGIQATTLGQNTAPRHYMGRRFGA